jgi:hypothetical protein
MISEAEIGESDLQSIEISLNDIESQPLKGSEYSMDLQEIDCFSTDKDETQKSKDRTADATSELNDIEIDVDLSQSNEESLDIDSDADGRFGKLTKYFGA